MNNAEKQGWNWQLVGAGAVVFLLLAFLYFWLFVRDDLGSGETPAAEVEQSEVAEAATTQLFAMTEVNIRDKPTTVGSNIIGKMPRGSALSGAAKVGEDGTTEWLELSEGKGFVAVANLDDVKPPELLQPLGDKIWVTDTRVDIYGPSTDNELIESAPPGTRLVLSGLIANGVLEVKLPDGRFGYILEGKEIVARLGGKPVLIAFNPANCRFGGEIDAEFEKIGAKLRAQWAALEAKEYPDEEARNRAMSAVEGRSTYQRLQRSYAGLTVTAIGQHYESQSVYFAEPAAKVIEVFRAKGFRIARDGSFPSTELYAGISGTRGEGTAFGKSELGCGV